jgi:hypothetical protein
MTINPTTHYGTVAEAATYFGTTLGTQAWDDSTNNNRTAALFMATRAIDRLNFAGDIAVAAQELQFPRGDDNSVPTDIRRATYECALKYLDGVDMDMEARNLGISANSFGGTRTSFNDEFVAQHLRAGIPSVEAWYYLQPYLRDPRDLNISRVS